MAKAKSGRRIGSRLVLAFSLIAASALRSEPAQETAPSVLAVAPPPLILGVAIDEHGISEGDLQRSRDLILGLLRSLPRGSEITIASFSGDKRIILPSTSDQTRIAPALDIFKAGTPGVALPDGLFDVVQYLASREASSRAVILVSAGRVREGDLHFEDPLNAAIGRDIRISCLAVGPGDGKLLRRIAKLTGGDYLRLEVADVSMLNRAIAPQVEPAPMATPQADSGPLPSESRTAASASLLGAAAIFFSVGGLLMLGLVVLLVRRLGTPAPDAPPAVVPPRRADLRLDAGTPAREVLAEDETLLEKTLVVNANPILRALSGPGAGQNFPLSASGRTSVGRSRSNDIVVPEDAASAQHCRIDREGDSYVLHDLGSTNGVWVNGTRIERAVLQHGDRLKVGGTVFTVSLFGDRS